MSKIANTVIETIGARKVLPSHNADRGNRIPGISRRGIRVDLPIHAPYTEEVDLDFRPGESDLEKLCRLGPVVPLI
jgi:hypothetical protein